MSLKEVAILVLAGEAYLGTLLYSYRHEAVGAVLHGVKQCDCASWRRCTAVKRRERRWRKR